MLHKLIALFTAVVLSLPVVGQSASTNPVRDVKVTLKTTGAKRDFYVIDMHQLSPNQCGVALQSFYNAKTFTVTSPLLEGNRIEISAVKAVTLSEIQKEVSGIVEKAMKSDMSGEEQLKKFKHNK